MSFFSLDSQVPSADPGKLVTQLGEPNVKFIHFPDEPGGPWRRFNPSMLCLPNSQRWMFYRRQELTMHTGWSEIWVAALGLNGKVMETRRVLRSPFSHVEDPRIFHLEGELHLSYIESTIPREWHCQQRLVRLNRHFEVEKTYALPKVPNCRADGHIREKNWLFYDHASGPRIIYGLNPLVILRLDGTPILRRDGLRWPWHPRGGCLTWHGGRLRIFFHACDPRRRYRLGCLDLDQDTGHILRHTPAPMATGSYHDRFEPYPDLGGYRAACVFPGSAQFKDGTWNVACGINDLDCAFLRFKEDDLAFTDR